MRFLQLAMLCHDTNVERNTSLLRAEAYATFLKIGCCELLKDVGLFTTVDRVDAFLFTSRRCGVPSC